MGLPRHHPTSPPRRRQPGTAARPHWGPEQGCRPASVWRPTQSSVWPYSSALAIPSLVRKSCKLAVEEWKVGNQTGSFLEGVFLSFIMVFSSSSPSPLFHVLLWFWFYFSSPFLSASIPSGTFLGWFFHSCLIPPGTFGWGGWSRNRGGDPKYLVVEDGAPVFHFESGRSF